ncbi:MAG: tRNA (adenosine(37)-N6)-threonylcarbamoyltransferase complex ATPase subunit type 1 TsaE [Rickettsiaceae bacterium]|nr:tRNA (adenosine(37)-N6)-threonylcarbamoyltransferase complex ATPase subunit type 1 TsaE [Rickettsiaceae bacterium]
MIKSKNSFKVHSISEMLPVINEVIKSFATSKLLLLKGDLGAGKTTFVKELLANMANISGVTSPTFNILNIYESQIGPIFHYDLYRLKSREELAEIGLMENISSYYVIIEWPDIAEQYLSKAKKTELVIDILDDDVRIYKVLNTSGSP